MAAIGIFLLASLGFPDGEQHLLDCVREGFQFDFPVGTYHGTWDFDEWPGVDHDKAYLNDYPFPGISNTQIDWENTHFDRDDHLGYLRSPGELDSHGFEDLSGFMKRSFDSRPEGGVTILTITAHPDDEAIDLGGLLGWSGHHGYRTVVISVTSGANSKMLVPDEEIGDLAYNAFGIDSHGEFKIERDLYGVEREAAFSTACTILGVSKAYLLPYPGGTLFEKNIDGFGEIADIDYARTFGEEGRFRNDLKEALKQVLAEEHPDLLFTHGSNGGYGHPMHLLVNELVTEVVQETGSKAVLFYSTPEMNVSDRITHYLYLKDDQVDYQSLKEQAFKAHGYVAVAGGNYDIPWNPNWNPRGILIKDYGWTPSGYPPPCEFYSRQ